MIGSPENPFDRFGLPPTSTPEEITELLRERMADASAGEQAELRALWERLMLHARERAVLALGAHPKDLDTSGGARRPPPRIDPDVVAAAAALSLPAVELVPLPSLAAEVARWAPAPTERSPLERLLADPLLAPAGRTEGSASS